MLEILFSWLSPFRFIGIWIDTIAYSLIDNAYNLIVTFSKGTLLKEEFIVSLMNNLYVVIGIFALFRIAMLLVNSIINPDKLSEKGNGLANVFGNFIIMFVMLVMTPFVFREAINLQTVIVDGNYIQKLFIKADAMEGKNPGKAMRSIAIGSLITLDEVALEQCEGGGTCSNNAKEAIEAYRDMEKNGFSFPTLSKYIGVSIKDDDTGEVVYVYNYMFLVTFAAGIFIAYVLFSFGIDIAVRMVELTVLQILAPLFIATYIDPKSAKSGTFHKWLTTIGKTYASLFIKLAILSLMLLLISIVSNLDYYGSNLELSGFEKLVLLFAILIFAKKAPKWIGDMVGVEGAGLGDFGIGKKLGGAALLGGLATKAGRGMAAAGSGLFRGAGNHLRNKRAQRNAIADKELGDKKARRAERKQAVRDGNVGSWFSKMNQQRHARKDAIRDAKEKGGYKGVLSKESWGQGITSMGAGLGSGFNAGLKAENLKGAFSAGKVSADNFKSSVGMQGDSIGSGLKQSSKDLGQSIVDRTFGDSTSRRLEREARELEQLKSDYVLPQYRNSIEKGCVKQGDFSKPDGLYDIFRRAGIKEKDDMVDAMAAITINPKLKEQLIDSDNKFSFSGGALEIKDKTGKTINQTILNQKDAKGEYISRESGKIFNDAGIANAEQLYMNKVSNVVSEREKLVADKSSLQTANNSAFATNQQLREMLQNIKINMPNGMKMDLHLSNIDDFERVLKDNRNKLAALSEVENPEDYKKTESFINGLESREEEIRSAFRQIADNDSLIESNRTIIGNLDKEISNNDMDDMVKAAAHAAKASEFDAQGIIEGLSREIKKAGERKETKKKES